jgi:hypothetical protein
MSYETRILALVVLPEGDGILYERATRIEIDDEGAGEFVTLEQSEDRKIRIDPDEWPEMRAAIDRMIEECRV